MNRILVCIAGIVLAFTSVVAVAQEASARTVQYRSQDIVPIHAKLKYTTLIQVPPAEKIMEAATGDKDFWVIDVVGNFCFVHPAKAGISSNLNLITDKGNIYSFYMGTQYGCGFCLGQMLLQSLGSSSWLDRMAIPVN
jgi:type IV secretion system protein VirB9